MFVLTKKNISNFVLKTGVLSVGWLIHLLLYLNVSAQLRDMNINFVGTDTSATEIFSDKFSNKSALLIRSTITGISFGSNMGILEIREGINTDEYLLIIDPVTQIITTNAPGYIQGRFRVSNVKAESILEYQIGSVDTETDLIPTLFKIRPQDAELYINGDEVSFTSPVLLAEGLHTVQIKAEGFNTISDTIMVSTLNSLFEYQLDLLIREVVRFRTDPNMAVIYLDDVQIGTTPVDNFFYPGIYSLRLVKEGYLVVSEQIEVLPGQENLFSYRLERSVSRLILQIEPENAEVVINDKSITTEQIIEITPGLITLEIIKEGYETYTDQFTLNPGETLEREINLRMKPGILQIKVLPIDAEVSLLDANGHLVRNWVGTNVIRDIPEGSYSLMVTSEGYLAESESVTIKENSITETEIILESYSTPDFGSLDVSVIPENTEIQVLNLSGQVVKTWIGSAFIDSIPPGNYSVRALMDGFADETERIRVSNGFTTKLEFDLSILQELPPSSPIQAGEGELQLRLIPSNATVELQDINGLSLMNWSGSSNVKNIPTGDYYIIIQAPGYIDMKVPIRIESDGITPVNLELQELRSDFIFDSVETMPELIGGLATLQSMIQYPSNARKAGIEGRVFVQFIVNEQGDVENPTILRGIGGGCDEEALRVTSMLKFTPGIQAGKPIRVRYTLPIVFQLQN